MRNALSFSIRRASAALLAGATLLLSGCAIGTLDTTGSGSPGSLTFTGKLIGGENPISGGAVSFYETSATGTANILARSGYYAPASPLTALGTVYTNASGYFSFTTPLACAHSTDYVYATAYGGNSGANAANPNILLAAAVGTCASFGASTYININEVTTVAAAYALAGFSSLSGTTLSVTSSATNYTTASTSTPSAAGLAHAFANAANLVNVTTGSANASLPSNPSAVVPLSVINALANSIQACVNSTGGTAGDGSACGNLFTYTTYTYKSGVSPNVVTTTVTPTNTFGALLAIARFPTVNVSSIYNLGSAQAAFAPAINAAPTSWALAIAYPRYDGATNGITNSAATNGLYYPIHLALDANDNVYVLNTNASPTAVAPATVQSQSNIVAFSSSGTPLYATAVDTTVNVNPRQVATDALGNLFMVSNTGVTEFNAASGSVTQNITLPVTGLQSIAIDGLNNLWVGAAETVTASSQNLYEYTCGSPCGNSSTYTNFTFPITPAAGSIAGYTPTQIFIDKNRNVWGSNYNATAPGQPFELPYKTTAYSAAENTGAMSTGTGYNGNYAMVVNNNGNGWVEGATQICKLNFPPSCGYYNDALPGASLRLLAMDGNGVMWGVDNFNGTIHSYETQTSGDTSTFYTFTPCVSTAATACVASSLSAPIAPQVDSTGSVWVTSAGNGGILQFIGAASPTWPVLSYLKPAVMP